MKKLFPLLFAALAMTLVVSCGGEDKKEEEKKKSGWSDTQKESFMESCVKNAGENPGINAEEYCSCMLDKVLEKYPSAVALDKIDMKWMMKEAQKCLGSDMSGSMEDAESSPSNIWDEKNKSEFLANCEKGLEGSGLDGSDYCSCMLEKVMVKYETPMDAANLDMEWMTEQAKECMGQ